MKVINTKPKNITKMKKLVLALFIALAPMLVALAQNEKGGCINDIPGLTEQQKKDIDAKKMAHHKDMMQIRNVLNEKKAHQQTLEGVDKPDLAAINKTIDEVAALKADMMKKQAAHRQEIRNLLNEEQKLYFDTHANMHKGKMHHKEGCGEHKHQNGQGCEHGNKKHNCKTE